jgi:hypothetical protein
MLPNFLKKPVIDITVFRSWHSRKRPNLSGSASSFVGCKIREILATTTTKNFLKKLKCQND